MSEEQTSVAETSNEANAGSEQIESTTTSLVESAVAEPTEGTQAEKPAEAQEGTLLTSASVTEEKTEETKTEEKKPAETQEGAPEQYESFKAPEGVVLDSVVMGRFSEVAKELNLTQAKAQEVIDKLTPVLAKRGEEQLQETVTEWRNRSMKTPEIAKGMADIARLRDRFAVNSDGKVDPEILEFMQSPIANHPGCLKLLARAGRVFGEASFPEGKPSDGRIRASDIYK